MGQPTGESGYIPVHEPLTAKVAENHLLGNHTLGVYPVRLDNTVSFIAFDLDLAKFSLGQALPRQADGIKGLGFVLSKGDGFVFIDLDKCLDPITGAIYQWVLEMVKWISSYTEISPSGQGLHIMAKGSLPPGGRKKARLKCMNGSAT